MRMFKWLRPWLAVALAVLVGVSLCGCTNQTANGKADVKFISGKMLHLKQVLEHYDANGAAVPQYLELWLTGSTGKCDELDSTGKLLNVTVDTGKSHIAYNPATLAAEKTDNSGIFVVGLADFKKAYPKVTSTNDGQYAGHDCTFYVLGNGKADEWVKLYVDKATGYVLLCDAPLFRLRTAAMEELPLDASMFVEPKGLTYKGGDGK